MSIRQLDIMDYFSTQTMLHGDCLEEMRKMVDNSIDFVVCDPPYGINFMGKAWDYAVPNGDIWAEALRICKPGSFLAAFGGRRSHHHLMLALEKSGWEIRDVIMWLYGSGFPKSKGCLKPAYEPIILARKKGRNPTLNINESRVQGKRWPANLILDEEVAEQLNQMTGVLRSGKPGIRRKDHKTNCMSGTLNLTGNVESGIGDSGGPSRFFYIAKASSKERNAGLEGMPLKEKKTLNDFSNNSSFDPSQTQDKCGSPQSNHHPTVKPIALMKYILKLLSPPGNPICLDPFAGSGSTLLAAKELGINCIGIEKELEYYEIAKRRIENHEY